MEHLKEKEWNAKHRPTFVDRGRIGESPSGEYAARMREMVYSTLVNQFMLSIDSTLAYFLARRSTACESSPTIRNPRIPSTSDLRIGSSDGGKTR